MPPTSLSKDAQFFLVILLNVPSLPAANWAKIASQAGYGSAKVAQTRWGQIKKKHQANIGTTSGEGGASPLVTPVRARPSPKKRKKPVIDSDDEDDEDLEHPVSPITYDKSIAKKSARKKTASSKMIESVRQASFWNDDTSDVGDDVKEEVISEVEDSEGCA